MDVTLVPGGRKVTHISLFLITVSSPFLPLFTGRESLCFYFSPISPPYNWSSWQLPVMLNELVHVFSQPWLWESRLAHGCLVPAWTKWHQEGLWVPSTSHEYENWAWPMDIFHPPELSGWRLQPTQTLRTQQFILFSSVHFHSFLTN